MLDHDTRVAILRLAKEGHTKRAIARAVGVSRDGVHGVLNSGTAEIPRTPRQSKLDAYLEEIRALHAAVGGNLIRVHEELQAQGVNVPYSTLTDFCRREGIGQQPAKAAGSYSFAPGEEEQHDTSPHPAIISQQRQIVQSASLVLCFSRMIFAQAYPIWNRFWAKVFLTEALLYFGGSAHRMMVDNSSVILARGSGKNAVFAPEMEAFARRFGFGFSAHAVGDANRSARVERPFHYIETNFYAGREFADLSDLNAQLRAWCDRANHSYKRHLRSRPVDLFVVERAAMVGLPPYVPEVYQLHRRAVDVQGHVHLHTNRYSAPEDLVSREVEVRETKDKVRIFDGPRLVCEHDRLAESMHKIATLPEHRRPRGHGCERSPLEIAEEKVLRGAGSELGQMVDALKKRDGGRAARALKRLHQLLLDYPEACLREAVAEALRYQMLDLQRLERMVLRRVGQEIFRIGACDPPPVAITDNEDHDNE